MPEIPLRDVFADCRAKAERAGVDIAALDADELKPMLSNIAKRFEASVAVVVKRLRYDGLIAK